MMGFAVTIFCVLASLTLALVASNPTLVNDCYVATPSPKVVKGANHIMGNPGVPLYQLTLEKLTDNDDSRFPAYKVALSINVPLRDFREAYISIDEVSDTDCGPGELEFDSKDFEYRSKKGTDCPTLISTQGKAAMTGLPTLVWRPPRCGCVQIRALVRDDAMTYGEEASVATGPLARLVCVQKAEKSRHFDSLCSVLDDYVAGSILSRGSFLKRHHLKAAWMDRFSLEMAIELRRADNKLCCNENDDNSRQQCFNNVQLRRIDSFCAESEPDIPFSSFRDKHMRALGRRCCAILGPRRYNCFREDNTTVRADYLPLEFSMDETDPVNDLAIFADDHLDLSVLAPIEFGPGVTAVQLPDPVLEVKTPSPLAEKDNDDDDDEEEENEVEEDEDKEKKAKAESVPKQGDMTYKKTPLKEEEEAVQKKDALKEIISAHHVTKLIDKKAPNIQAATLEEATRTHMEHHSPSSSGLHGSDLLEKADEPEPDTSVNSRDKPAPQEPVEALPPIGMLDTMVPEPKRRGSDFQNGRESTRRTGRGSKNTSAGRRSRRRNGASMRGWRSKEVQNGRDAIRQSDAKRTSRPVDPYVGGRAEQAIDTGFEQWYCCKEGRSKGKDIVGHLQDIERQCKIAVIKTLEGTPRSWDVSVQAKCWESFVVCCTQRAVRGLEMSSTEFRETYTERAAARPRSRETERDYDTDPDYDQRGEVRYRSMREGTLEQEEEEEDEEVGEEDYTGPNRFDEVDNDMAEEDKELMMRGALHRETTRARKLTRSQLSRGNDDVDDDDDDLDVDEEEEFAREFSVAVDPRELDSKMIERREGVLSRHETKQDKAPPYEFDPFGLGVHATNLNDREVTTRGGLTRERSGLSRSAIELNKESPINYRTAARYDPITEPESSSMTPLRSSELSRNVDARHLTQTRHASISDYVTRPEQDLLDTRASRRAMRRASRRGGRNRSGRRSRRKSRRGRASRRSMRNLQSDAAHHAGRSRDFSQTVMDSQEMAEAYYRAPVAHTRTGVDSKEMRELFSRKRKQSRRSRRSRRQRTNLFRA